MTEKTEKKEKKSIYETLSQINVSKQLEHIPRKSKKTGKKVFLDYLSWPKAWGLVKAIYPDTTYEIREYENWVKTPTGFQQAGTLDYRKTSVGTEVEVTAIIEGHRYTQKLYVMDRYNNPIMNPTIKDINKTQLRCLVKALATAGLGLNVYAGEDLPSNEEETAKRPEPKQRATQQRKPAKQSTAKPAFKPMSEEELKNYTVMYKTDEKAKPMEFKLSTIYTFAVSGDEVAQSWIRIMIKKQNTPEGHATAEFCKSKYAAEIKNEIKKKQAVDKIKQHNEEKQEA